MGKIISGDKYNWRWALGWTLVEEITVKDEPQEKVTFSNLDLEAAGKYLIYFSVYNPLRNPYYLRMYLNQDKDGRNYSVQLGWFCNRWAGCFRRTEPIIFQLSPEGSTIGQILLEKTVAGGTLAMIDGVKSSQHFRVARAVNCYAWHSTANVVEIGLEAGRKSLGIGSNFILMKLR